MKTLYILRHGQTEWNQERRIQGRMDSPLTEAGRDQADVHGKTLKTLGGIDHLFVSPSGRTRETAFIVNSYTKASIKFEDALMERDCGEWSGQTLTDIEARDPEIWAERVEDPYHFRPPGGENLPDMHQRVADFLVFLKMVESDVVGLVTHGVMSRVVLSALLDLDPGDTNRVHHPNDVFYRLSIEDAGIEVDHFKGGDGPRSGLLRHAQAETIVR